MKSTEHKRIPLWVLLVIFVLLTACGGIKAADIEDTDWSLDSINDSQLLPGTRVTLRFTAETLEGFAGCNRYGATYSLKGSQFKIPEISSTAEGCLAPEGIMDQEETYLNILSGVDKIKLADRNTLEMQNTARDSVLIFRRELQLNMNPTDLDGTAWALRALEGNAPLQGTPPTLSFRAGTINGSTGCRTFTATYNADGDNLQILTLSMNEIACLKPEPYREQENRLLDRFDDFSKYKLSLEQLELMTFQGETLVFGSLPGETVENAEGFTWILDRFSENGEITAPLPGVEINLIVPGGTLKASGTFSGSAGCTLYDAPYAYDGSVFTLLSPTAPEAGCEPAVNSQQQRYLEILSRVKTIEVSASTLLLNTVEGQTLSFFVAGSVP